MKFLIKPGEWVRIYNGIVCDERSDEKLHLDDNAIVVEYISIYPFILHPINIRHQLLFTCPGE